VYFNINVYVYNDDDAYVDGYIYDYGYVNSLIHIHNYWKIIINLQFKSKNKRPYFSASKTNKKAAGIIPAADVL